MQYVGEFKNGLFNGQGIIDYGKFNQKYAGEFKISQYEGLGIVFYIGDDFKPMGMKYIVEWKDGHQNGDGLKIYPDGSTYPGKYKKGSLVN